MKFDVYTRPKPRRRAESTCSNSSPLDVIKESWSSEDIFFFRRFSVMSNDFDFDLFRGSLLLLAQSSTSLKAQFKVSCTLSMVWISV